MNMTDPTFQLLAYELALVFGIFSLWLTLHLYKKNKKIQADAVTAVKKIKRLKDRRLKTLTEILSKKYGLAGQALEQTAQEFQQHEQNVYKAQLALFIEQDSKILKDAPNQLEAAIDACLNLLPVGSHAVVRVGQTDEELDDKVALTATIAATAVKVDQLIEGFRLLNSGDSVSEPQTRVETAITDPESFIETEPGAEQENTSASQPEEILEDEAEIEVEAQVEEAPIEDEDIVLASDIDALLADVGDDDLLEAGIDLAATESEELGDIPAKDDIDAILNQASSEMASEEVDIDDIDAILDQASNSAEQSKVEQFDTEEDQLAAIMANIGEDTERGESEPKKLEAEPAVVAADSANTSSQDSATVVVSQELNVEQEQLDAIIAGIENDQQPEISELESEIDKAFSSEEALLSAIMAEAELELEAEIVPEAKLEPEIEVETKIKLEHEADVNNVNAEQLALDELRLKVRQKTERLQQQAIENSLSKELTHSDQDSVGDVEGNDNADLIERKLSDYANEH